MQMTLVRPAAPRRPAVTDDSAVEHARSRLEEAMAERDHARELYEASIGTSVELSAYMRVRAASQQVSAADKWLRWAEGDFTFPPPSDDAVMESLLASYD